MNRIWFTGFLYYLLHACILFHIWYDKERIYRKDVCDMSAWATQTLQGVHENLRPLPEEEQQAWLASVMKEMPDGVTMASAMDTLGFDMTKVQEDGSYSVSMEGFLYGQMYGLGLVDTEGQLDMGAISDFATQSFTEFTDEQKNALLAVGVLNQTSCSFLTNPDGTPYDNPDGGFDNGSFLNNLGKAVGGDEFVASPEARMSFLSNMAEHLDSESYAELTGTNVTLDVNTMMQFQAYQRVAEAVQNGTLSQDMVDSFEDSMQRLSQREPVMGEPTEELSDLFQQGSADFREKVSEEGPNLDSSFADTIREDAYEHQDTIWRSYEGMAESGAVDENQKDAAEPAAESDRGAEAEAKFGNILEQAETQSEMQME